MSLLSVCLLAMTFDFIMPLISPVEEVDDIPFNVEEKILNKYILELTLKKINSSNLISSSTIHKKKCFCNIVLYKK